MGPQATNAPNMIPTANGVSWGPDATASPGQDGGTVESGGNQTVGVGGMVPLSQGWDLKFVLGTGALESDIETRLGGFKTFWKDTLSAKFPFSVISDMQNLFDGANGGGQTAGQLMGGTFTFTHGFNLTLNWPQSWLDLFANVRSVQVIILYFVFCWFCFKAFVGWHF